MKSNIRKKKMSKKTKIMLCAAILLIANVSFYSFLPTLIMPQMVDKHVDFEKIRTSSEFGIESEKIKLKTEDELNIVSYQVNAEEPKGMVIMLSGIDGPSVTEFFGQAAMLKNNGYSSFLIEQRSHGESEGTKISLGMKEYLDVKAGVNHIKEQEIYKQLPIIVYGISMGGATAINSAGEIPEIDGVISASAFSSWPAVFEENMAAMGIPSFIGKIEKPFLSMYLATQYGISGTAIKPINEIKKLGDRPILLMHSKGDTQVPFANYERLLKNAPKNTETYTKDGDYHFICKDDETFHKPETDKEFTNALLGFLDKYFSDKK